MKHKILTVLMSLALIAGFSACNEKWEPVEITTDMGTLSTADLALDILNAEKVNDSRASIDLSNYIVVVTDVKGTVINEWTYSTMPGLPMFPVGDYTLSVESHIPENVAWEKPHFKGSKTFSIAKNAVTPIGTVTCSLRSLKITVNFSSDLVKASAGDLKCVVNLNTESSAEFTPAETRAAYFVVPENNTTLMATFTGTVNGVKEEITRHYTTDVKGGVHRVITFTLKSSSAEPDIETGTMDPTTGISVDMTVTEDNLSGSIGNDSEEVLTPGSNPGDEEWNDPENPDEPINPGDDTEAATFTSPALDLEGVNSVEVESAIVDINCPKGVKNLLVTIESDNDDFIASAGELLPLSFDLANPGDAEKDLGSEGLKLPTGDEVLNKTDVRFDVSGLVPLLTAFPGNHLFKLVVVDNNGNQSTLNLKFKA